MKGVMIVKKVLIAWIEQVVQFDSAEERKKFTDGIRGVQVLDSAEQDGKFTVHVKRPYNNNPMDK